MGLSLGVAGPVVAKGLLGEPYSVLPRCEVSFSNSTTAGDGPTSRTVREQESTLNRQPASKGKPVMQVMRVRSAAPCPTISSVSNGWRSRTLSDECSRPSLNRAEVLVSGRREGGVVLHPPSVQFRVGSLYGGKGHALPASVCLLPETLGMGHADIPASQHEAEGLAATQKVAAVGGVQVHRGQPLTELPSLAAACLVQGHIGVALEQASGIPVGLAVPHQEPLRHGPSLVGATGMT